MVMPQKLYDVVADLTCCVITRDGLGLELAGRRIPTCALGAPRPAVTLPRLQRSHRDSNDVGK